MTWIDEWHKRKREEDAIGRITKALIKQEQNERRVFDKVHTAHKGHAFKIVDMEYFDAMFVAMIINCNCGAINLKLTREDFED
jgi:hypothetical protein